MKRLAFLLVLTVAGCGGSSERIIVGAGTTLVDSGFIAALVADYEAGHPGVELSVLDESSAQILSLGRSGAADILFTHAPEQESAFLADENPQLSEIVFSSEFLLVGPADRTASLNGLTTREAFAAIAANRFAFVSRGDGSGTHETELMQWANAAPSADWYLSTGQGMGLTLQVADQREAFTLAEAGAYYAAENLDRLVVVDLIDPPANPYRVTVIAAAPDAAVQFAEWLLSESGSMAMGRVNQELFGATVYQP